MIRRFLLHVLPDGFMRIRHFGFLANRAKKHALPQCRKLLGLVLPCPSFLKNQPTIFCWNFPASIFLAALVA